MAGDKIYRGAHASAQVSGSGEAASVTVGWAEYSCAEAAWQEESTLSGVATAAVLGPEIPLP